MQMDNLIKRYNIIVSKFPSNDNIKVKRIKARLKHKIIEKAKENNISLFIDTYNFIYQEKEYQEILDNYNRKSYLYIFKMNKLV